MQPDVPAFVECLMTPVNQTWLQPSHLMYSKSDLVMPENLPVPFSSSVPFFLFVVQSLPQSRGSIWYMIVLGMI